MAYLKRSWAVFFSCLRLFSLNKRLIFFPLFSILVEIFLFMLVFGAMLVIHFHAHLSQLWHLEESPPIRWIYIIYLLIYYCLFHFVSLLINCGLLNYQWHRFQGKPISIMYALGLSIRHSILIVEWMLVFSCINIFMAIFEKPGNWLGKLSVQYFGLSCWLSVSLIFPMIIFENLRPLSALRSSAHLIKKTWGERISRRIGFSFIYFLFLLPLIYPIYCFFISSSENIRFILAGIIIIYLVVITILHSVTGAIFQLVLYGYLKYGKSFQDFEQDCLDNVFW